MNQVQFDVILRKLVKDPNSVLAAARRRSPSEGLVIANSWEPEQGFISPDDALDLFLTYLKEDDVPDTANTTTMFSEAAIIAFTGLLGLGKLISTLDEPSRVTKLSDAWPAIYKWSLFLFSTRIEGLNKDDSRRKSAIVVVSIAWYTLCHQDRIRNKMIATPMTVEIATRLWLEAMAKRDELDRVLRMAGGKADELAKLALSRLKAALKVRPLNGTHLTMHLDFINSLSRVATHKLRYALLGANVIWVVTNALTTISIHVNTSRDPSFLDAMVSGFGYLSNCLNSTDGFTWVSQSVGAGLLTAFVDCSPQFSKLDSEDLDVVLKIVKNILPRYTIYRSVLEAMDSPMRKIDRGPQRARVSNSAAKDAWFKFFALSCDRMRLLRHAEAMKGKHITCDNVKCQKIGTKEEVRRCSACLTTFYCSKECQAIAWKEGDHKNVCKMKQRERTEGKSQRIYKRDLAFFHNVSMYDAKKNMGKLWKQAAKDYPDVPHSHLVICIDYSVVPATYDLVHIDKYDTGPNNGTANAQARNDAMIEKVQKHPGRFTLLASKVSYGQDLQCILTLATGSFWEWDAKEAQRRELIETQVLLRQFVSRLEEHLPDSEKSPILTDPIRTEFPDDELVALAELSDMEELPDDEDLD